MTDTKHKTTRKSASEIFYDVQCPANAIQLAIADHVAFNNGNGIGEYMHQLRVAHSMCQHYDALTARVAELEAALADMIDVIENANGYDSDTRRTMRVEAVEHARAALAAAKS
jgi:hypothetical protein